MPQSIACELHMNLYEGILALFSDNSYQMHLWWIQILYEIRVQFKQHSNELHIIHK